MPVAVRTASYPSALVPAVRDAMRGIDASLPLNAMKTQRQQIAETIGVPRMMTLLTALTLVGANPWANQVADGMISTNMTDHVSWGL